MRPQDKGLTFAQIDRKYTRTELRRMLIEAGKHPNSDAIKTHLVNQYMALPESSKVTEPGKNVTIERQSVVVKLVGKDCDDSDDYEVYFRYAPDGRVEIVTDLRESYNDYNYHTTVEDLRAVVEALEANR